MKKLALLLALWLFGTVAPVQAEVMQFRVYFGPVYAGKLWFEANGTEGGAYSIRASIADALPFVRLNDTFLAEGTLEEGVYRGSRYTLKLEENDYRAHKQVTLDRDRGLALYENKLDARDPEVAAKVGPDVSDALSTLWTLRREPVEAFDEPREMQVLGVKRPVDLRVQNGLQEKVEVRGKHMVRKETLHRIDLLVTDPEKPDKSTPWSIWVRPAGKDGGLMQPVVFSTKTKWGTFTAYLQEG